MREGHPELMDRKFKIKIIKYLKAKIVKEMIMVLHYNEKLEKFLEKMIAASYYLVT